jgi:hypothetical protein
MNSIKLIHKKAKKQRDEIIYSKEYLYPSTLLLGAKEDNFSKLSDELILRIFHWLPRKKLIGCSIVCKRWYRLMYFCLIDFILNNIQTGSFFKF